MTDDQTLLDLAGRATPSFIGGDRTGGEGYEHACQLCGEPFIGDVMHTTCDGCERQEAFRRAANPERITRLISEKRSEAARADLTGFMLAWVVAEYEQMKAHLRQSLHDQSAALADPEMPILTQAVREQLRDEAEASYAMADNEAERVYAHGLSLLCDWQDRAAEAKASKPLRIPVELDEAQLPGAPQ
jgi:hypothetical protein